ncbi:MAG: hypothetical protein KA354_24300 [Phycisphaerae bacterium]|nr:hypothetical protein [Phycisphaerae bacterium]
MGTSGRSNRSSGNGLDAAVSRSHVLRPVAHRPDDAQGKTWDQIAAFVGHLDPKTTRRYIHFMPKDKRATVESIPFEF